MKMLFFMGFLLKSFGVFLLSLIMVKFEFFVLLFLSFTNMLLGLHAGLVCQTFVENIREIWW